MNLVIDQNRLCIESFLQVGDITLLAKHFGIERSTVYNYLRYHSNTLKAHEVRSFAVNMLLVRMEELQKALPQLKERVSKEYSEYAY